MFVIRIVIRIADRIANRHQPQRGTPKKCAWLRRLTLLDTQEQRKTSAAGRTANRIVTWIVNWTVTRIVTWIVIRFADRIVAGIVQLTSIRLGGTSLKEREREREREIKKLGHSLLSTIP